MAEWNKLDKFIANIRYKTIERYIPRGGVIADIGCGREAAFLKQCSPLIKRGYGFDFRITNKVIKNLKLINNKNSEQLDIKSSSCDAVFMLAVLEHLDDPKKILDEIYRILKPGGMLCLTTPTPIARPILECMAFKLHIMNEEEILEHKHYYISSEIYELVRNCGFANYKYKKFCFGVNSMVLAEK